MNSAGRCRRGLGGDRVSAELSAGEITTLLEFPAGPGSDATISYSAHMSLAGFVAAIEEGAQDGDELPPSLTGGVTVIRRGPDGEVAVPAIVRTYTIDWDGDLIADVRTVVAVCDGVRQFSATIDSNLLVLVCRTGRGGPSSTSSGPRPARPSAPARVYSNRRARQGRNGGSGRTKMRRRTPT